MRKLILNSLILLILGGLIHSPTVAYSQSNWQWSEIEVISAESTLNSDHTSSAIDPVGNIHLVWDDFSDYNGSGTDWDIFYKKFDYETQNWGNTVIISTEGSGASYLPVVACDTLGNIFVVWQDSTNYLGSGTDLDIFYKKFEKETQTWSTTEVISSESSGLSTKSSITIDNSNSVHVVWYDSTDYDGAGTDYDIFYKKLDNDNQIWSSIEVLSTESTSSSTYPEISSFSNGDLAVFWQDETDYKGSGTDFDIFYKKLDNKSQIWSSTEVISTESSSLSYSPAFSIDEYDDIHVVWYDTTNYNAAGNDYDIFYKKWDHTLQSWSWTNVVSSESTGHSRHPDVICDSNGIHVVWADLTDLNGAGPDDDIFYKYRNFDETSWSSKTYVLTVNSGYSSFPEVTIDHSQFLNLVWTDDTNYSSSGTDTDIFYSKLSGPPQAPVLEEIHPNPSNGIVNLEWNEVFSASIYRVYRNIYPIHSIEGLTPIAETSDTFYVDTFEDGTYYYAITANNPDGSAISNMVYVQIGVDNNYLSIITEFSTEFLNVTHTDDGFLSFSLSIPVLLGSLTFIIMIRRRKK